MKDDTIVAIATASGAAGIGVVRLSGPEAEAIGTRIFRGKLRDRRAVLGAVCDPKSGEMVDEALGLLMRAPRTYTREDTVELQAHGGSVCLQRVVELSLLEGARLAEPGEFTLRAFLNGRLDLAQAESVLDIIQARTEASLRLAVQGLGGRLSHQVRSLRLALLDLLGYLSARADFPDEDVPAADIAPGIYEAIAQLRLLIATADYGMIYRQGTRVAIVGSPNVGKSSLMNRLLREDRVIVTAVAGTTRDTVEETVNLGGVPVILMDTAGLGETGDPVEQLGVARSLAAIERTDALLIVLDGTRGLLPAESLLLRQTSARPRVVVMNKCDLEPAQSAMRADPSAMRVSALTGEGLETLEQRLSELATGGQVLQGDAAVVTNPRHKAALLRSLAHLDHVRGGVEQGLPEDMASVDLRAAIEALGEITGEAVTEDLLDTIFRNFCIGK